MNTDVLTTFVTLAKIRNYTRTADELFITQSTVTSRIANLEKELSATLFIRNHNGLLLTPAGETFLSYAEKMLEMERTAFQNVKMAEECRSLARIGCPSTIFDAYLLPRIRTYAENHPDYSYKFTIDESSNLFRMLQEGLLDIIYSVSPFYKKGYVCKLLQKEPFCLVASPDLNRFPHGITHEALLKVDLINTNYILSSTGQRLLEFFPPHHNFFIDIYDGPRTLALTLNGLGYSVLPYSLVAPYIADGRLIQIPPIDFSLPEFQYFVIRSENCLEDFEI